MEENILNGTSPEYAYAYIKGKRKRYKKVGYCSRQTEDLKHFPFMTLVIDETGIYPNEEDAIVYTLVDNEDEDEE